jgi:hypothetical protein
MYIMSDSGFGGRSPRAKTVLFCAVCGHESPADGDWTESTTTGEAGPRLLLACPDCATTVARRRVSESSPMSTVVADD